MKTKNSVYSQGQVRGYKEKRWKKRWTPAPRNWRAGKRGKIDACEPKALTKLGLYKNHWAMRVKGIGLGYWLVVGELDDLVDKAKELGQRTMFGTGFARFLKAI
jgi:hypothetical protein